MTTRMRIIALLVVAILGASFLFYHGRTNSIPKYIRGAPSVSWLPLYATNVTAYTGDDGITCFECDMPLDKFFQYAKEQHWDVKKEDNFSNPFRGHLGLPLLRANGDYYNKALVYEKSRATGYEVFVVYDLEFLRMFVYRE